jgi:predicted RNA-binding protein with PIN domain
MSISGIPVLLVDGHNVIHAWPDFAALHRQSPAKARMELCRWLTCFQDEANHKVVVVFDGRGSQNAPDENPHSVQVFYASASGSADAIIARLAHRYAETYPLSAASDDLAVQHAVAAAGGTWISTTSLRSLLENSSREFRRRWKL